ncbi:tail collar domain [Breoghania corrubedonensis]|uniref:Tail collar domain n=1 Tax=Breoghania corrubedonensis TaxID=665038 RepID=A0A2T5VGF2_9HYPH|nr:phage tail protein [Breoghania corrubedonensis]PTW62796.1 tail collar domain [Breoghania corrubedonensis]
MEPTSRLPDAQIDMGPDVPVGTIVAYFGSVESDAEKADLEAKGWLSCDGDTCARDAWPDLFAAIGTAFGNRSDDDFCLPDLRGVFLRGQDADAGRDPDAAVRIGSGPGGAGAAGDAIGSLQTYATALPRDNGFKVSDRLAFGRNTTHGGGGDSGVRIRYHGNVTDVAVTGGDTESRPVNITAHHLIKAKPNTSVRTGETREGGAASGKQYPVGQIPVGAVISAPFLPAFDDNVLSNAWRICNGATYVARQGATFFELFRVIGTGSGGARELDSDATKEFDVPDLAGMYLRGVPGERAGVEFDPDRDTRLSPRPDREIKGNSGNTAASYETWATGLPRSSSFVIPLKSFPFNASPNYDAGSATAARYRTGSSFSLAGGDAETRPASLAVNWHIRFQPTGGQTPGAELPVGVILATATDIELENWKTCDGADLDVREYASLFAVLGTRFGGDGDTTFKLPDMRGRFLRGAGRRGEEASPLDRGDPPAVEAFDEQMGLYQDHGAASPKTPFTIYLPGYPDTSKDNVASWPSGSDVLKITGDKTIAAQGGDAETRPINVSVRFIIKTRS